MSNSYCNSLNDGFSVCSKPLKIRCNKVPNSKRIGSYNICLDYEPDYYKGRTSFPHCDIREYRFSNRIDWFNAYYCTDSYHRLRNFCLDKTDLKECYNSEYYHYSGLWCCQILHTWDEYQEIAKSQTICRKDPFDFLD